MSLTLRAKTLLSMVRDPSSDWLPDYARDGKWMTLTHLPNIGKKTVAELVKARLLEERPIGHWSRYEKRWYRLATPAVELFPDHEDFGDLWVA